MKSDILRTMALKAKNRMRSGYNPDTKVKSKLRLIEGGNLKISIIENFEEERLYDKVCSMLDENMDINNPISVLLDKTYLSKLDELSKERYVLTTAEKYSKLKKRYLKEHEQDIAVK